MYLCDAENDYGNYVVVILDDAKSLFLSYTYHQNVLHRQVLIIASISYSRQVYI